MPSNSMDSIQEKNVPQKVYDGLKWNMMVLVEICFDINPQRAMAVFGEKDHGKTTLGWNVPSLKTLFSALTNRKHALNKFGVKSSWSFQDYEGYTEAMWIHHFLSCSLSIPIFVHVLT